MWQWPQCCHILEAGSGQRGAKTWRIFQKPSKMYATVCLFCVFGLKNVEKKFKNPHKIEFFHVFHIFILKMWSEKPLVYIAKARFPRFHVFENLFGKKFLEKIF